MEQTVPEVSKFRLKQGVGAHYYKKKRYVAGDEIEMPEFVAEKIMHKLVRLSPAPDDVPYVSGFAIVHLGGREYNVVNDDSGKAINDEPLTLKEAQALAGEGAKVISAGQGEGMHMRHRGGGRYVLVDDAEKPIVEDLFTKAQAQKIINGDVTIEEVLDKR